MKSNILVLSFFLSATCPSATVAGTTHDLPGKMILARRAVRISASQATSGFIPFQLVDFAAHAEGGDVRLTWETNMEQNNRGFDVEYSTDCSNWQQIGFVAGAGDCFSLRQYAFVHVHPSGALNYYRLVEVDYDNGQTYSEVAKIALGSKTHSFQPFPNPATTTLFVPVNSTTDRFAVRVVDIAGQPVRLYNQSVGKEAITLDISDLRQGIYFIETDNLTTKTCLEKSKIQKL
jgi:hypothetical protein